MQWLCHILPQPQRAIACMFLRVLLSLDHSAMGVALMRGGQVPRCVTVVVPRSMKTEPGQRILK